MPTERMQKQMGAHRPLPAIVFRVEQKVRRYNGDAHGDYEQNAEHEQHEAVHVVELVRAKKGKGN